MATTNDHELMLRSSDGDSVSFEELMLRWQGAVSRTLRRLVGPSADVEELSQEVFLKVYGARKRYRPTAAFSTWLYRIVLNVARDATRRRWWRRRPLDETHPAIDRTSPSVSLEQRDLEGCLKRSLAGLPAKLREVLVLKHYAELTFEEMSRVIGVPTSTIKSRLRIALNLLHGELRRSGFDGKDGGE